MVELQQFPIFGACENKSERPVDALAVKKMNYSPTDNLKSRDASAPKNLYIDVAF